MKKLTLLVASVFFIMVQFNASAQSQQTTMTEAERVEAKKEIAEKTLKTQEKLQAEQGINGYQEQGLRVKEIRRVRSEEALKEAEEKKSGGK